MAIRPSGSQLGSFSRINDSAKPQVASSPSPSSVVNGGAPSWLNPGASPEDRTIAARLALLSKQIEERPNSPTARVAARTMQGLMEEVSFPGQKISQENVGDQIKAFVKFLEGSKVNKGELLMTLRAVGNNDGGSYPIG
jgi:hypothetical protein